MNTSPEKQHRSTAFGLTEQFDTTVNSPGAPDNRIHYLDNLRAVAMILGVLLHAGLAYADPAQEIWLATDRGSSRFIDGSIWFVHLFRMALFFFIAGYFGKLVASRKGIANYLKNRALRIAIPFIVFWPVLYFVMGLTIGIGMVYVQEPKGILKLIRDVSSNPELAQSLPARESITTMHLWFLYYLILFSLMAAALSQRLTWITWDRLLGKPWLLLIAPVTLVPAAIAGGTPMAAPESFIPTWWPFAFYGLYFWVGWLMHGRESILEGLSQYVMPICIFVAVAFAGYYRLMPTLSLTEFTSLTGGWLLLEALLTAYLSASLVALSLLAGKKFLSGKSTTLRWIADASYWTYLVHLPLVIFFQMMLVESQLSVWVKFPIVVVATLIVSGVTYLLFVRYTPIGWLLNGKRTFP